MPDWSRGHACRCCPAANWGGQGLHPRGNFEGFVRAASKQKWLEVHGIEHWTHFYTDYGVALQKRFFGHFLKGEDTGWTKQPQRPAAGAPPGRAVRRAPGARVAAGAHAVDEVLPRPGRATGWSGRRSRRRGRVTLRRPRRRRHVPHAAPARPRPRSPGPSRRSCSSRRETTDADLFLVVRVFTPTCRRSPSRARSTRTRRSPRAGCAPRTASSTRRSRCPTGRTTRTTRRSRSRRGGSTSSTSRSGRPAS